MLLFTFFIIFFHSSQGIKYDTVVEKEDFVCPEEFGYFGHPLDCSQYYVCVFGGALLESCTGGLMYSHELQTCDWPRNVYCNNGTLARNNLDSSSKPQRVRSTTESNYVYKPIKIENYSQLSHVIANQDNQQINNNGRTGRSYQGNLPNYKEDNKHFELQGRRRKRSTLLNFLDKLRGIKRPTIHFKKKRSNINSGGSSGGSSGGGSGGFIYPPNYYIKPTYSTILHPLDLRTTNRPDFKFINPHITFRGGGGGGVGGGIGGTGGRGVETWVKPYDNRLKENVVWGKGPLPFVGGLERVRPLKSPSISLHNYLLQTTTKIPKQVTNTRKHSSQNLVDNYDYYYYDDDDDNTNYTQTRSVNGRTAGKYTAQDYPQQQPQPEEYLNQRYAANTPANNTASYVYENVNNDDTYYVYDDNSQAIEDDVDYKPYSAAPVTSTRRPTTTTTVKTTVKPRTRSRTQTNNNNRPTLKPKSQLDIKSIPVRDVYLDLPSRPLNVYETPLANSPASKCRKDSCILPDCNCGGKEIPGGLRPEDTPQLVVLTFDDSVNDLNKNLYRDLFEKGRKNPNGCPISATFYVSHEWTDYSQVQNLAADGHEIASHSVSHSFGESFSAKKWEKEINGQREILSAYGGVKLSEVRGMRAPFLAIGGNNMFKMLHDANFTYDSSMPVYENRPPSYPYTLDYKIFHDCMIPPCPTKSYPGVWEVPMVMWQDLKGGRCSMGDACSNPPTAEGVYQMLAKNFERHYTTNRAPFGLYYHAAWFTQAHHKEGFEAFLDTLVSMDDVWLVTNWQTIQWVRNPTPNNKINNFEPFNNCHNNNNIRPPRCNHPKVCNLWHKSGVRYMKTCQTCPQQYPWTGNTGVPFTI